MQPLCLVNNIYHAIWSLENLNPKPQPNLPGKTDPTFGMQNRPSIRPCVLGTQRLFLTGSDSRKKKKSTTLGHKKRKKP
jgi:hypothetical protein